MIKFTDIHRDPNKLLGHEKETAIIKHSQVVAYVVTPERMEELLYAEEQFENAHLNGMEGQKRISVKLEDL